MVPDEDDPTIENSDALWRRIPPFMVVPDQNLGISRPSSQAFKDHPDGSAMSVELASVLKLHGLGQEHVLAGPQHAGFGIAAVTAGLARECRQGIVRKPTPDNPAHAEVFGDKPKSVSRRFAREAQWIAYPDAARTALKV
jgi:hypothetical protein